MKLTREGCQERQQRVVAVLQDKGLAGAVLSRREHVLYLTGFQHNRHHAAALFLSANGELSLVGSGVPEDVAADEVIPYEAGVMATMHSRQHHAVAEKLAAVIPAGASLGTDWAGGAGCVCALAGADAAGLTLDMNRLRKRKLPDEVDAIRAAIRVTEAMYTAAKAAVCPGADEVEVLAYLRSEATKAAGEDLEHFGNDFQADSPGGPARRRRMQPGELYILDAGPSLHGFFADNCRTFAVDRQPTDAQLRAWQHLDSLFPELEAAVKPGVAAADVFQLAHAHLSREGHNGLMHHLGHGIGLTPHETPELNPEYDAVFEAGDVFTMEPGLYAAELHAGIRLEENYLLTQTGLEKLTSFPRGMV